MDSEYFRGRRLVAPGESKNLLDVRRLQILQSPVGIARLGEKLLAASGAGKTDLPGADDFPPAGMAAR